jgi:hypothetical protein
MFPLELRRRSGTMNPYSWVAGGTRAYGFERRVLSRMMAQVMQVLCLAAIGVLVRSAPLRAYGPEGIASDGAGTNGGSLVCWGQDVGPADGTGSETEYAAIALGAYHGLSLDAHGVVAAWGENGSGQAIVPSGQDFTAIAAGFYHSLALRSDGSIVAWGDNTRGQRDAPSGAGFVAIAAGHWHSLAIRSDGSVAAWGWNEHGQCDVPAGYDFTAVCAGLCHSLALRSDGSLVAWGGNGDGQCDVPSGNDFTAIAAGSLHSLALRRDGSLAAWGRNDYGQCNVPQGGGFVAVAAGGVSQSGSDVGRFGCCLGIRQPRTMRRPDGQLRRGDCRRRFSLSGRRDGSAEDRGRPACHRECARRGCRRRDRTR